MADTKYARPDLGTKPTRNTPTGIARESAEEALAFLLKAMRNSKASPQARIMAAEAVLRCAGFDLVQEWAGEHARDALAVLHDVMRDPEVSLRARTAAARGLLEYVREEPAAPARGALAPGGARWLDEIKEIREEFAAGRLPIGR